MVRQELQFGSNGKEKFALLILTLITRHMIVFDIDIQSYRSIWILDHITTALYGECLQ